MRSPRWLWSPSAAQPLPTAGFCGLSLGGAGVLLTLAAHDLIQTRHALLRNYPVIGWFRFAAEAIRPEIQQYFVESDVSGAPFARETRAVIYQRAKGELDKVPFGTQRDVYEPGHELMMHAIHPAQPLDKEPRLLIGSERTSQHYEASRLNISAMSYGALSPNAIRALNLGAQRGGFAHNTGEGGLSPYHLEHGGDLIWQIGTGYFGCRDDRGHFDIERFVDLANHSNVKMIEVKLSQGAKPGHGGILPAEKLTPEIAAIRGVPIGQDVVSPPHHTAYATPAELIAWIGELRAAAKGKPVGIKLCFGRRHEFLSICKAMIEASDGPDFITIDGSEGGTGAAPLELADSVGLPLKDGLGLAHQALILTDLRRRTRLIAAGKVSTGFDLLRLQAMGADACNAARSMMIAIGCIQARRCHTNTCPVGIATQDPKRGRAIDVDRASERVRQFHHATIHSYLELLAGCGVSHPNELEPEMIQERHSDGRLRPIYDEGGLQPGALIHADNDLDPTWRRDWALASER